MSTKTSGAEMVGSLLRREKSVTCVPLYDSPWGDTLKRWTREGMPTDAEGNPVDPCDHFGFDMAGCGGWFDWQPKAGVQEVVEETADWKIVRNGAGALHKCWKEKSGTPEHIDFHMTNRSIWEKEYRQRVVDAIPAERVNAEAQREGLLKRKSEGKWTFFGSVLVWEVMRASMGDEAMFMALMDDPEWIRDFTRVYTDFHKRCYAYLFEKTGLPDGIWIYEDLGYKDKLFCSPAILEEQIFPRYKEMVDFFHSYGLPVVLHSCGYQKPMLDLVVAAGFDALNPMEVKAGNDIFDYAERYGERLAFIGGLDARILESGDRAVIRAGVESFIGGLKARGARFVFGSDHSVSTNVSYADFQYALEVYRECGRR